MLDAVTPVILTFNEEPNLGRTLDSLRWADRVVVVDSGSTDATRAIAAGFSNVSLHERPFDSHAQQWDFGVNGTDIRSEYVLALDADMATPGAFVAELGDRFLSGGYSGGVVPFELWMMGRRLAGSLLRPQLRLFRRSAARIEQRGHTQAFSVDGPVYVFAASIRHDDRKPIDRWVRSQVAYSSLEANRLAGLRERALKDRLRAAGAMPLIAGVLAYVRAGGPFSGTAALRYAYERVVYECLLAMRLQDRGSERLDGGSTGTDGGRSGR
jgi:glycosyltransferase involved in cell wall biosynthesis